MEKAANMLLDVYRHVLIYAAYDNYTRIRFRPDLLKDTRCYFNKVKSQHSRWLETGGALVTWKNTHREGTHDAIVIVEFPKSLRVLKRTIRETKTVAVIYQPPIWRPHIEKIEARFKNNPHKRTKNLEELEAMFIYAESLRWFTPAAFARLQRAPQEWSPTSPVPGSPLDAARSAGTAG